MLHKLKPVPRALVILGIVGGIGFGATKVDFSSFKKKDEPAAAAPAETTVVVPPANQAAVTAPTAPAPQQVAPAPAPAPAAQPQEQPLLQPAAAHNSGMEAVLRAGKK